MLYEGKLLIGDLEFPNQMLEELAENLLKEGFRVFVFQDKRVTQIFFEDKLGRIGSCQGDYGFLSYYTEHRPSYSSGTGFCITKNSVDTSHRTAVIACATYCPHWFQQCDLKKWKSFEQKAKACTILTYYELES